ncbi:MAG: hypothetical protein RLZZ352_2807 [Pseudomonadota bacterium]|jgi:hypothetical protein
MQVNLKTFGALALVLVATGCAHKAISDFDKYRSAPLVETEVMPTPEQLQSQRTKIVVLEADDSSLRGRLPEAGILQTRKIEAVLTGSSVEIVDRSLARKLTQEIAAINLSGEVSKPYTGPAVASTVVKSFVNNVSSDYKYTPSSVSEYKGKRVVNPHYCTYTAGAAGEIRIYELPSFRLLRTFAINGDVSSKEEAQCRNDKSLFLDLQRKAVEDSVQRSRVELKNVFAPKGYVVDKRISDKNVIFKVMVGKLQGAAGGDKLRIFTVRKNVNLLTKKTEFEEVEIATGVFADGSTITDDSAWIIPDDPEQAKKIRLGDFVKVEYKKGLLEF